MKEKMGAKVKNKSFCELIDQDNLQRLQDEFSKVTGLVVYCLDGEYKSITAPSGEPALLEKIKYEDYERQALAVLERVEEGALEDQAVEELEAQDGHVAAIAIRVEGMTVIYWIAFDLKAEDGVRFYNMLDLLYDASKSLFTNKFNCLNADAKCYRGRYTEQEMNNILRGITATTEMVQMLDSNEKTEKIMSRWLKLVASYIQPDMAQIFWVNAGIDTMNVMEEWCAQGVASELDMTSRMSAYSFLRTDKPLVISTDSDDEECQKELNTYGMKAVMLYPIMQENGNTLILALRHCRKSHIWDMTEISFTADAVKLLQSILNGKTQKASLKGMRSVLETALDSVCCAVYVTDKATGEVLFINRALKSEFASELKENTFPALLAQGMETGKEGQVCEIFHVLKNCWYDLIYREIVWVDGRRAIVHSLYDITDKKLYQKRIEQQAYTDFLTGLYNRMCCEKDLARQIDEAKKSGEKGALCYLDLDDFKHINDGLGHHYGDVLLKAISHSLQRIEGIENTCYRMGGDEFVIVIPPTSFARFDGILKDIQEIFSKPWFLKNADYYCTMSMGIVTYPDAGDSVADLIKKADIAMYEAKKTGKNRVARYSEGTDTVSGKRLNMEKNMRDAAVEGYKEFEVYYQPIIDIQGDGVQCAGAEALIRWNSEKLGFIPPSEFIPLAEYLGLINPIGNFVLLEACKACKEWNDRGFVDYKVNVNLSVVQLLQNDIVEIVERTLKQTGLEPRNLTLEVTESLAINDMERMKGILNGIKALGVKLALDDFGTGYSSLNHIREIPFDVIKVDQSFVKGLAADAYSQSFIKMVAELADTLGMSICVEGIETEEQFKTLQGMKVKYIQGYYFDRPMQKMNFQGKYAPISDEEA